MLTLSVTFKTGDICFQKLAKGSENEVATFMTGQPRVKTWVDLTKCNFYTFVWIKSTKKAKSVIYGKSKDNKVLFAS